MEIIRNETHNLVRRKKAQYWDKDAKRLESDLFGGL